MGMYTTLKFSGIVKKEYRETIDKVINYEESDNSNSKESKKWKASGVDFMMQFAKFPRADYIPNGGDDFVWDKNTGVWDFTTEVNNYNICFQFISIAPLFMDTVSLCKLRYEEFPNWDTYHLQNDAMVLDESDEKDQYEK